LNAKTEDLLALAKDFNADAQAMNALMQRKKMMVVVYGLVFGVGMGGTIGVPIIMCCV